MLSQNPSPGHCGLPGPGKPPRGAGLSPAGLGEAPRTELPVSSSSLLSPLPPLPRCCLWEYLLQHALKIRQKSGHHHSPIIPPAVLGRHIKKLVRNFWLVSDGLNYPLPWVGAPVKQWELPAPAPAPASGRETGCDWTWAQLGCPPAALPLPRHGESRSGESKGGFKGGGFVIPTWGQINPRIHLIKMKILLGGRGKKREGKERNRWIVIV